MLHPSYSELINKLNIEQEDGDENMTSRYSVVIAAAKRARQLVDGAARVTSAAHLEKAVSVAVKEISEGKIKLEFVETPDAQEVSAKPEERPKRTRKTREAPPISADLTVEGDPVQDGADAESVNDEIPSGEPVSAVSGIGSDSAEELDFAADSNG